MAKPANSLLAGTLRQLRAIRKAKGITTEQLAERLDTAVQNVRRIEAGQNITLRMLDRIATALGVQVRIAFEDAPEGPKSPAAGRRGRRSTA